MNTRRRPVPPSQRGNHVDAGKRVADRERPGSQTAVDDTACALSIVGAGKNYGDTLAVGPLDLQVAVGERIALIGHNGSGKTTLMRMVAGLLEVSTGSITVRGRQVGSIGARAAISYVSDSPTFYDDLTLWEHLEYVARLHGVTEWEQTAADLLGEVGLYGRADDLPNRFSRGLKQKAALALGFVRPFETLLIDEPFVGLDAAGKEALLRLLATATEAGATVIVATHDLAFVHTVGRIIALRDGALVHDGPADGVNVDALVRNEDPAGEHDGEGH